ncbi:hypothetical protein [Roseitalea porphyridii]|uniref:Antifreeze protein n=1 Tax=Roseitalea porphyridii TaxID=1852022 RepID=A0A4P6V2Q9_9HYPH|nr:hypothetical protein [Roseitalea porphyridii]QBK31757.1 hypothetical protein E0E05_14790 [Roseitalea porphyridii]
MFNTRLIAAGLVVATALGAAAPAQARPAAVAPLAAVQQGETIQIAHRGQRRAYVLPRRAVVRSLYRRGYRDVHRVHFRNGYWRARAYGRRGLIALTVHPRSGEIVHRRVVQRYQRHVPRRHLRGTQQRGGISFSFGLY